MSKTLFAALTLMLFAYPSSSQGFSLVTSSALGPSLPGGWASAWGDYDNDDYPDLLIIGRPNQLYHNNGDGTFTSVTVPHLTTVDINQNSAVWTDVNNDGYLDLLVNHLGPGTPIPQGSPLAPRRNFLYINQGPPDYALSVVSQGALQESINMTWTSSFVDFDNDGDLDLVSWGDQGDQDHYFVNQGDGTFVTNAEPSFLNPGEFSAGGQFVDMDSDGDLDLFVTNFMRTDNELYENLDSGNGTQEFILVNGSPLGTDRASDLVASWGDTDGDGDLDVFVPVWEGHNDRFYRNDGSMSFTRITAGAHVTRGGLSLGNTLADVDNDGDLDLYVSDQQTSDNLYENTDGTFRLAPSSMTGDIASSTRSGNNSSVSAADYDLDGDMDLVIATSGAPHVLLRNDSSTGNGWLHVSLEGTVSNRLGVGARVSLKRDDGTWLTRVVHGGPTGDRGQNHQRLHFGLGLSSSVDSVVVEWPSGTRDILENVAANQILKIVEGAHPVSTDDEPVGRNGAPLIESLYPNPLSDQVNLVLNGSLRSSVDIRVFDLLGRLKSHSVLDPHSANNFRHHISTTGWAAGTYLINVSDQFPSVRHMSETRSLFIIK